MTNMDMSMNPDETMFPTIECIDGQQQCVTQHNNGWLYNPVCTDYSAQQSGIWPAPMLAHPQPSQQPHFSTSTQASFPSKPRTSSNASVFSQWQSRSSIASTSSSWSNVSEHPHNQRTSSLNASMDLQFPMSSLYAVNTAEGSASPTPPVPRRKTAQRSSTPEKDTFTTCVSRTRRSRRSQREPRYWCTSCEEPFIEKYDWKRHEETYQERRFIFRCNLCSAVYFLEKDFLHHHVTRHNCETCQRDEHLEAAKQNRQARTGWGCGFCTHFSTDWRERCNHIAKHFEKDRKTMKDWRQSDVIHSLLQRPAVRAEWCKILQSQPQLRADFGWNQHNTGRVEGYPENDAKPYLQDLLEYYKSGDNAAELAQLAFRKIAFPSHPPQAPRKDYKDHHNATLQSLMDDPISWNLLMSNIPEDEMPATNVCDLDFNVIDDVFGETARIYY